MYFIDVSKEKKEKYVVEKQGKYVFFLHNISGKIYIEIQKPNTEVYIFGLFIGRNNDVFKLETVQHHRAGNSFSNLLIKGVCFDRSKFIYEGLIRIEKKAQKSHAYQKNQNLVMSKDCFVDSRPVLEILANDVFCTHGSTTGGLNEEQLYFLQSRGLEKAQAAELLVRGFVDDLLGKMRDLKVNQLPEVSYLLHLRGGRL